jgi:hypothetical protein
MHIFLDTNAVLTDPFFRNNHPKVFLKELRSNSEMHVYISDMVIPEIYRNYERLLIERVNKLIKAVEDINKLTRLPFTHHEPSIDDNLKEVKQFWHNLLKQPNLYTLDANGRVLRTVYNWAKAYKAPFFSKGSTEVHSSQFKDAVILQTYITWCRSKEIKQAHFITNNGKDFIVGYDPKSIRQNEAFNVVIRGVLFSVYTSIEQFLTINSSTLNTSLKEHPSWLIDYLNREEYSTDFSARRYTFYRPLKEFVKMNYYSMFGKFAKDENSPFMSRDVQLRIYHHELDLSVDEKLHILAFNDHAVITKTGTVHYFAILHFISEKTGEEVLWKHFRMQKPFTFSYTIHQTLDFSNREFTLDGGDSQSL